MSDLSLYGPVGLVVGAVLTLVALMLGARRRRPSAPAMKTPAEVAHLEAAADARGEARAVLEEAAEERAEVRAEVAAAAETGDAAAMWDRSRGR